jgi:PGF-CTERM protein
MPLSANKITSLLLTFIAVLLILSAFAFPTSATTIIQLQPNTISSGGRVLLTANLARNGSTATISYYYDVNKTGLAPEGATWVPIAQVTDGGANDSKNTSNGFIEYSWMTPELSPGQYIIKVDDPHGPTRTTLLEVTNTPLTLTPTIYGPAGLNDTGVVNPGNTFSVIVNVTGNCRLCHTTNTPTLQNPGINVTQVDNAFSSDLSQITGNPGDTAVPPDYIHHQLVEWMDIASKTLADNQTVNVTVTGTNPAGNLTTQSTAYAGVNTVVSKPPTSTTLNTSGSSASPTAAQSSGSSNPLPGFEAVFAVVGLTLVAFLVSKRR